MENQTPDFKKHSKAGFIISIGGILIMLLSVFLFIYLNREKEEQIVSTQVMLDKKDSITVKLNDSLKIVTTLIQNDQVECIAKQTPQSKNWKQPQYTFTFRLTDTTSFDEIDKVDYFFNHPTFTNKLVSSTNPSDSFSVSYIGWGCLSTIEIFLHHKTSRQTDTLHFPMCDKTRIELIAQ